MLIRNFGTVPAPGEAIAVAATPDNKLVVLVQTFAQGDSIERYRPNGEIDPTFGRDGVSLLTFSASAIAVQRNGKVLVVGSRHSQLPDMRDLVIARYTSDGRLDQTFGTDGSVIVPGRAESARTFEDSLDSILVQPNGRINVMRSRFEGRDDLNEELEIFQLAPDGHLDRQYGIDGVALVRRVVDCRSGVLQATELVVLCRDELLRLNPDGTLDTSFGTNGRAQLRSDSGEPTGIAIGSDGGVVVSEKRAGSRDSNARVSRFRADGSPDLSFGDEGHVAIEPLGVEKLFQDAVELHAVSVQPDGTMLVAGRLVINSGVEDFLAVQLTAAGKLDPVWGGDGRVVVQFAGGGESAAHDVAVLSDGRVVAVGGAVNHNRSLSDSVALAAFRSDGNLDPRFGRDGRVLTSPLIFSADEASALLAGPQHRLIVAGTAGREIALLRLRQHGSPDRSFGNSGRAPIPAGVPTESKGESLAPYPGQRLLVGSGAPHGGAVLRYHSNGAVDASFGKRGVAHSQCLDQVLSLAVLGDGKILAAGMGKHGSFIRISVERFTPTGRHDSSFGGNDGCLTGPSFEARKTRRGNVIVRSMPDGRFLLAGSGNDYTEDFGFVKMYLPDGKPDPNFDDWEGVAGQRTAIRALAVDRKGRIVLAGSSSYGQDKLLVVRLKPDGKPDPSFGRNGAVEQAVGHPAQLDAVRVEPSGGIVVAGTLRRKISCFASSDHCPAGILVARYDEAGRLDPTFGRHGMLVKAFGTGARVSSMVLDDGTITVGGWVRTRPADRRLLLLRLHR